MKKFVRFLFLLNCSSAFHEQPSFASTYYWVGDGGNWSEYNLHWASTSGGQVFYNQAPGLGDDVIFDQNSFTLTGQTVTIDGAIVFCKSFLGGIRFRVGIGTVLRD